MIHITSAAERPPLGSPVQRTNHITTAPRPLARWSCSKLPTTTHSHSWCSTTDALASRSHKRASRRVPALRVPVAPLTLGAAPPRLQARRASLSQCDVTKGCWGWRAPGPEGAACMLPGCTSPRLPAPWCSQVQEVVEVGWAESPAIPRGDRSEKLAVCARWLRVHAACHFEPPAARRDLEGNGGSRGGTTRSGAEQPGGAARCGRYRAHPSFPSWGGAGLAGPCQWRTSQKLEVSRGGRMR